MKTSQTVYLSSFVPNITGISPFTLTIDPINIENYLITLNDNKKIYKIQYDFGDGTVLNQFAGFSSADKATLYPKSHTYYVIDPKGTTFTVNISLYQINRADPITFSIILGLKVPSLEQLTSTGDKHMFDSVHLVGTRMFGTNDNILYFFQGKDPNYLLPAIVNWSSLEPEYQGIYEKVKDFLPNERAFELLSPFENEFFTSIDKGSHIETVKRVSYIENPDNAKV